MHTKILMTSSSVFMGLLGIAALFFPGEILQALNQNETIISSLLVQMAGTLLFAFAMLNWMSRLNVIGGIYNRPVAIGNFTHFMVGAIFLIKTVAAGLNYTSVFILCAVYIVFAIWFGKIFFTHPVTENDK